MSLFSDRFELNLRQAHATETPSVIVSGSQSDSSELFPSDPGFQNLGTSNQ